MTRPTPRPLKIKRHVPDPWRVWYSVEFKSPRNRWETWRVTKDYYTAVRWGLKLKTWSKRHGLGRARWRVMRNARRTETLL